MTVCNLQITYAERLTKIGLVVAEIFGRICRFLPSRQKRCSCYPHNLWGYWTECHQIVHNVEKFILFNILKSELRYCNPFCNPSRLNYCMQHATIIAGIPTCWNDCNYCSALRAKLRAIIVHETTAL